MRLADWRAKAPTRDALSTKVTAVVEPVLAALGAERDAHVWVAWGDDPHIRYTILASTPAGLAICHVRVNVPGEGPRASGKLVRWSRVQLGELGIETQAGHRLVSFQVEGQVLRGADAEAEAIAAFAMGLFAGADGRPMPEPVDAPAGRALRAAGKARSAGSAPRGSTKAGASRARAAARPPTAGSA